MFHRVGNEISNETKELLETTMGATIEIVPPDCHRRNAVERDIRTGENYLMSMTCASHNNYPLFVWCCHLPQSEITLNLLRK